MLNIFLQQQISRNAMHKFVNPKKLVNLYVLPGTKVYGLTGVDCKCNTQKKYKIQMARSAPMNF